MLSCFIRYRIDPVRRDACHDNIRSGGRSVPRCGATVAGLASGAP